MVTGILLEQYKTLTLFLSFTVGRMHFMVNMYNVVISMELAYIYLLHIKNLLLLSELLHNTILLFCAVDEIEFQDFSPYSDATLRNPYPGMMFAFCSTKTTLSVFL